jgi:hypothetical protein
MLPNIRMYVARCHVSTDLTYFLVLLRLFPFFPLVPLVPLLLVPEEATTPVEFGDGWSFSSDDVEMRVSSWDGERLRLS